MDLNKLTIGDRVVAISAILFLIFMFFPWYGLSSYDENGFEYFLSGWLPLLLAIVMVVQIALTRFGSTALPRPGPLTWGQVHLIAGAVAAVLVLLRVLITADFETGFGDIELDRKFGVFLALLATLGLAAGGFLKTQEPETAGPPRGGPAGGPPPPPPPPSAPPPPPPTA